MLNKVTGLTLYEKIVWELKNLIAQGVYRKGELLPSEKELMEMTGVSRVTVREALRILAEVGIIETKK
ncbi:MAG: FadR/GntR family transcriptional regulator, partial [Lachnospiraceae bacterium]